MGTNFYCKCKIPKHKRKDFINDLEDLNKNFIKEIDKVNPDFNDILDNFKELLENKYNVKEIHLGKRSYGWQFLWDYHNGLYFKPTLASIKEFLNNEDLVIYNEYGEIFTVDQLFNDELKSCLYKDDTHTDGYGDPSIGDWHKHYFINDNLRFSKFEDFC